MEILKNSLTIDKIITKEAIENVVILSQAIGASTNVCLHLFAICNELGAELNLNIFNKYRNIPTILGIAPNGPHGIIDLHNAGGVPAVLRRIKDFLNLECKTVSFKKLKDIVRDANILNEDVIRDKNNAFFKEGAIAILYGNLAKEGSVVKQSAVKENMLKFMGKACVYNSEDEALQGIIKGEIKEG